MSATPTAGRFENQVAIITGASRGIGRGIALAFAREGADIILNYASNDAAARDVLAAIEAEHRRCILVPGSVANPEVADRLRQAALENFGRLDVLVNNAGISRDGNFMMLPDTAWKEIVTVNLHGAFFCCQAVLSHMIQQKHGIIINISSTAGMRGRPGQVAYATTKGALIGLTRALARELGPGGIRVNAVAPGFIETDMVAGLLNRPGVRERFLQGTPLRRFGTADDVASATLFLASPESSFITGEIMLVNGGILN